MDVINYTPPQTVKNFIKFFRPAELFRAYIVGPFGSGKTTGNFFKAIMLAQRQAPSPADKKRKVKVLVVRNTSTQLRDTTIASFLMWFKPGIAGDWHTTIATFNMKFGDVEIEWLFRGLDTPDDVARVLSLDITFAILDEFVLIRKEIVEGIEGRCGRYPSTIDGGATNWGIWGASNTGNEDSWWHEYLEGEKSPLPNLPPAEAIQYSHAYFKQPDGFSAEAENIENLPGGRAYYTSLAEGKTEGWIDQYIRVEWGFSLEGTAVITTFNRELHVAKKSLVYNKLIPLVGGFDPGMNSAMIFMQQDLTGRLCVLDELVQQGYGAERFISERLNPLMMARFADAELIISPDPAANQRTPTNESTVVKTFRDKKFTVKVADDNNRLPPRIEAIEYFTTRLVEGRAALVIDPRCRKLIRALGGGWRYGKTQSGEAAPEPLKNDASHPADGFSYGCKYYTRQIRKKAKVQEAGPREEVANPYALR